MRLHSPAFDDAGQIPPQYTADGLNLSPPLQWSELPPQARSLCLILDDPDAPAGLWVHWVLYDIPPEVPGLPAGLPRISRLPDGSCQGRCWGVHHFPRLGYHGPQPPPGPAHRYRFTLTALSQRLGWSPGASAPRLRLAMQPLALAEAVLVGTYAATASSARH
jgi:Raf kinase inhibitor-like YbhB/YbcL family protein